MATELLIDTRQEFGEHHVAHIRVRKVPRNLNRPDGFKINCVLIDLRIGKPVLLLDNHYPFGYHIHPMPHVDKSKRESIQVSDPYEAIDIFIKVAEEKVSG